MNSLREYIKEEIDNIFLLNEVAVSEEIKNASNLILDKIIEIENETLLSNWKKSSKIDGFVLVDRIYINSKDLFFKDLWIDLRLIKIKKTEHISEEQLKANNYGTFNENMILLNDDKKISRGQFFLNIAYVEGELKNNLTLGCIYHEVLHYYEAWKRFLKYGNPKVSDIASVRNSIQTRIKNECNGNFLLGLSEIIYYLCYFERNAFMATLYGELINTGASSIEDLEREFKNTKTYQNYYVNLQNPQLIFNSSLCSDKNDLYKINEIIEKTISNFNQVNINNKVESKDLKFFYKNESIEEYANKIFKLIKKEEAVVNKKLPFVFKKILADKQKKIKTLNEIDFNFNEEKIFPGRL